MRIKKIIALLGVAGSGKDTVARYIREELREVATVAFADPMKEFAREVFDFPTTHLWGPSHLRNENFRDYSKMTAWALAAPRFTRFLHPWTSRILGTSDPEARQLLCTKLNSWFTCLRDESIDCGLTPRRMLQTLGTECGRSFDKNIWVSYGLRRAAALLNSEHCRAVVITDCRFLNEAEMVRGREGEVWLIDRPSMHVSGVSHASELDVYSEGMRPFISHTVDNSGSLDALYTTIRRLVDVCFAR